MITSLIANPLMPAFISEIYFDDNEWIVELYDYMGYELENLDGCELTSSSGSALINDGVTCNPYGVYLITQDDLQTSLSIDRDGDMLFFVHEEGILDEVYFGEYAGSNVNPPRDGQSLVRIFFGDDTGGEVFYLAKENEPSLGTDPFSANSYGSLTGYVYDVVNNPVQNAEIELIPSSYMSEFYTDENGYFDRTLYGMNYSLRIRINGALYVNTPITIEPDSISYFEFYTPYDPDTVEEEVLLKREATISNYPNPFNPKTEIFFEIPSTEAYSKAKIRIFNAKGQEVVQIPVNNGRTSITWIANDMPSGIFFYKLFIDEKEVTANKMLLLK